VFGKKPSFLLSAELQKKIFWELLPLGQRCWELAGLLEQAGWNCFRPRVDFEMSFADGEEELQQYRRYQAEYVKMYFAISNFRFALTIMPPYDSDYLQQLRQERDAEVRPLIGPGKLPVWANELAKSLRKWARFRDSNRADFDREVKKVEADQQERRVYEIARHATGLSSNFGGEVERPAGFYRAVLERESRAMGFAFDQRRSVGNYIVVSKSLTPLWDLCLTPETLEWYPGRKDGWLRSVLSLQPAGHRRRPLKSARPGEVLAFDYHLFVPHFWGPYNKFATLDELEVIVMANMYLLSLVIKDIEGVLLANLPSDAADAR
jgi:hypothetical protein